MFSYFNSNLIVPALIFEIIVVFLTIFIIWYGIKNYKFFLWRYVALLFGVFAFEALTGSFWVLNNFWKFAYIHNDLSWIMTLFWTNIIFLAKFIYDKYIKRKTFLNEYLFIVSTTVLIWAIFLSYLKYFWIFDYAPEIKLILDTFSIFNIPIITFFYFPLFIFVVYTFYKYRELAMYNKYLFQDYSIKVWKDILIVLFTIIILTFLFYPVLEVSFVWVYAVLIVFIFINLLITSIMISFVKDLSLFVRFLGGSTVFTILTVLVLDWLIKNDYLTFSESILKTHTQKTINMPFTQVSDVEFFAILLFSYLLITMVKFFRIVFSNKNIKLDESNMTFRWFKSLFFNIK